MCKFNSISDILKANPEKKTGDNEINMVHTRCIHKSSRWPDENWFPSFDGITDHGLANHPHCIYCGTVKNISSDKAKSMGYYTGVLGRMEELKKIQVRMISKELQAYDGFDDTYALGGTWQTRIFIDIVKKYANIPEQAIIRYL